MAKYITGLIMNIRTIYMDLNYPFEITRSLPSNPLDIVCILLVCQIFLLRKKKTKLAKYEG